MTARFRVALISTGGTIEKTYDALEGALHNSISVLDLLVARLDLKGVELVRVSLMNKDSLEMMDSDHTLIAKTALAMAAIYDGVVVVHGTDRLQYSGERTVELMEQALVPIVYTGAMVPYDFRHTDAVQNVTESLLAVQILSPGVYSVFHNQVLRFPGVVKDRARGCFIREEGKP